jgi:hypothetical protein
MALIRAPATETPAAARTYQEQDVYQEGAVVHASKPRRTALSPSDFRPQHHAENIFGMPAGSGTRKEYWMMNDQLDLAVREPPPLEHALVSGMPIYDAVGARVGTVGECDVPGGYLVMPRGWRFAQDLYIPLSAIGRFDPDALYLSVHQDQIAHQYWEHPPRRPAPVHRA